MQKPLLYTIGHSNRPIQEFLELLEAHGIKKVIDIRTIPKSRHNPQFNQSDLRVSLKRAHIRYEHMKKLGGLRHAHKDSLNGGWINASFRGFADYMQTTDFETGLSRLEKEAQKHTVAIMCAEAVPWRCHRSMIADALTVRGWVVRHIQSRRTARLHKRTGFLRIRNGVLTYPASAL
jgi:uncharacterized protein (DUF488 family)